MMHVWRLSVAYIIPKSRTERSRKTKIGTEVAHVTCDSDATFKVKRPKVNLQRAAAYCGGLPHSLFKLVKFIVSIYCILLPFLWWIKIFRNADAWPVQLQTHGYLSTRPWLAFMTTAYCTVILFSVLPLVWHVQVFWLKDGERIDAERDINFIISHEGSLIVNQARLSDNGNYTCGAQNIAGRRLSESALLSVYGQNTLHFAHVSLIMHIGIDYERRGRGTFPPKNTEHLPNIKTANGRTPNPRKLSGCRSLFRTFCPTWRKKIAEFKDTIIFKSEQKWG